MDLGEVGAVGWNVLAQNSDQWRVLVNVVMKFGFYSMLDNY
jgi:hypothetical protein